MASTTSIVQIVDVAKRSERPHLSFFSSTQLHTSPNTMQSLGDAVEKWNNLSPTYLATQWKLLVLGIEEPVGYIPDEFAENAVWPSAFDIYFGPKLLVLDPKPKGEGSFCPVEACNRAFARICEVNVDTPGFEEGVKQWLKKRDDNKPQDFHPIFTCTAPYRGLKVPSQIRGILGIVTAGIHMTAYSTTAGGAVDRIWVSQRAAHKAGYPRCYDQIVAGGMDPEDDRSAWLTFSREAREEANLVLDGRKTMWLAKQGENGELVPQKRAGEIETRTPRTIYFCTQKDQDAGPTEDGHVEPGVRFCFDLKVETGVDLNPNAADNSSERFFTLSVEGVKESLKAGKWKPNSGLVMLDFLLHKGLVDEDEARAIRALEVNMLPLKLPPFKHESGRL